MTASRARGPWWVRLLSRAIPASYREEVIEDLLDDYRQRLDAGTGPLAAGRTLCWQLLASAIDSHRHSRESAHLAAAAGHARSRRLTGFWFDVKGAWRQSRARPWLTLSAVVTVGLALAANTAFVGVIRAVLVRPLPIRQQQNVMLVWSVDKNGRTTPLTPGRGLDVRARSHALSGVALLSHESATVTGRGPAERWAGASVSSNFFDVLDAAPLLGSAFHGASPARDAVVLSYRLWQDKFGGDPAVVGRPVVMNGRTRVIAAVMPVDFYWPIVTPQGGMVPGPLFWTCAPPSEVPDSPIGEAPASNRTAGFLRAVARLAPGVTLSQAQAELKGIAADLGRQYLATDGGKGFELTGVDAQFFGSVRRPLLFLTLASGLLVVLACVNVANLLLVRLAGRSREFAVRAALGAGFGRLARQLLLEGGVIAAGAGILGVATAALSLKVVTALAPANLARLEGLRIDGGVLAIACASVVGSALLLGLLPAWILQRDRRTFDLRATGVAAQRLGVRNWLVGIEVACAVTLAIGASLFGESLLRLRHVDVGFDTGHLLTFDVALADERADYQSKQVSFFEDLLSAIREVPGVRSAGGAVTLPIGGDDFSTPLFVEGQPLPAPGAERHVGYQIVGSGWFQTLGMTLREGRDFTPSDTASHGQVVVVNETLASQMWPGRDPLGQRVRFTRKADAPWFTVVGVVTDIRHLGPGEPPRLEIYETYFEESLPFLSVAVRTAGDPLTMAPAVRRAAMAVDPGVPLADINTMAAHLDRRYGDARVLSRLTLFFGGLALVLAAVGVYSVVAASAAQRTREFGVRTALGATTPRLVQLVLREGLRPVAAGAVAGLLAAAILSRTIRALLFDTASADVSAYVVATMVVLAAAVLACWLPARRAARIDPVVALRD